MRRLQALKTDRSPVDGRARAVADYLLPFATRFFASRDEKAGRSLNYILDSTGTYAVRTGQSGLMSGMTSPARPWFQVKTRDRELNKYHAVKVWLDEVAQIILEVFNASNVYPSLHEMYGELLVFGTACSFVDMDRDKVVHLHPFTFGEYWIAQDYKRRVSTLYRECEMSVDQVVGEFGYDNCTSTTKNLWNDGVYDAPVKVVHAIEPRRERDPEKMDGMNMAWRSCYFESAGEHDGFLRESGYPTFPVLAPRWDVSGGDVYGSSPGMIVYGDVKQLQHEQLRKGQCIDFQTKPALVAHSSMANRESEFLPGGVSYTDNMGSSSQPSVRPAWEVNLRLDYLLDDIRDVRQRINQGFYADLFLMLANAGPDTRMTATEVAERHEEKLLMLGPVLNRLRGELLEPLVEITFQRLMEGGALPPPPPELEGHELSIEFVSILAQAQKAIGVNNLDRFMGGVNILREAYPEVRDRIDIDKWVDVYADKLGVESELIIPKEDAQQIRDARAKQQAAIQQTAAAVEQAKAINQLGNTPAGGDTALAVAAQGMTGYSTPGAL